MSTSGQPAAAIADAPVSDAAGGEAKSAPPAAAVEEEGRRFLPSLPALPPVTADSDEVRPLAEKLRQAMNGGYLWYRRATGQDVDGEVARVTEQAHSMPLSALRWEDFGAATDGDAESGLALWQEVKEEAREELRSGHRAASVLETYYDQPMDRARFLVLRESLAEEWQPRGGIEWSLIDQMAQAYSEQERWTKTLAKRSREGAARDEEEVEQRNRKEERRWRSGTWIPPRQSEADAVETAAQMMDRFNRMYLRLLRQLRDLRRYAPPAVIVNQPGGQVNVADRQINVSATTPVMAAGAAAVAPAAATPTDCQ